MKGRVHLAVDYDKQHDIIQMFIGARVVAQRIKLTAAALTLIWVLVQV